MVKSEDIINNLKSNNLRNFFFKKCIYIGMCTYITMAKNISLSDEAYKKLSLEKRPDESFSDVVLRLLPKRRNIKDVIGKKLIDKEVSLSEIKMSSKKSLERIIDENT